MLSDPTISHSLTLTHLALVNGPVLVLVKHLPIIRQYIRSYIRQYIRSYIRQYIRSYIRPFISQDRDL